MNDKLNLGVIIVTYNRLELLKECLENCLKQNYPFKKILIVNNASTDGTKEYLSNLNNDKINIINLKENCGGSGGFYYGCKFFSNTEVDYVLLIDDDAILDVNYNLHIFNNLSNNPNIVGYSGTVYTNQQIQKNHRRYRKNKNKFVDYYVPLDDYKKEYFDYDISSFCGLYIPTSIFNEIGYPIKDFFIWFDDTEFCIRLNKKGKIRNINSAYLNHKTTINNSTIYSWKSYYALRNQIYILKKHYSNYQLAKKIIRYIIHIIYEYLVYFLVKNKYHKYISIIFKDALIDGMKDKLGKNEKYLPGIKV